MEKCNRCKINDAELLHSCPFDEDINNCDDIICDCCDDCVVKCINDI